MIKNKRILLIVGGGIAAYKSLDLIRLLREHDVGVRCILTGAGEKFVSPLSLSSLSQEKVYQDLFSLTDEAEMGHIQLARQADVIVVAPATAHLLACMAHGLASDLATTCLLAAENKIVVAPSMNVTMWSHRATQDNMKKLIDRGVICVGPDEGALACGEWGAGRMACVQDIFYQIHSLIASKSGALSKRHVIVSAGPTYEPLDGVRFLGNRSSGKQGYALAKAFAQVGARVTLVSGPVHLEHPLGVEVVKVQTALEMKQAIFDHFPADCYVGNAAVSDFYFHGPWDKKREKSQGLDLSLSPTPDILQAVACEKNHQRPQLVIGFAAQTHDVVDYAMKKLEKKGCDWIFANDVHESSGTFGGDHSQLYMCERGKDPQQWPHLSKQENAQRIVEQVINYFQKACSS